MFIDRRPVKSQRTQTTHKNSERDLACDDLFSHHPPVYRSARPYDHSSKHLSEYFSEHLSGRLSDRRERDGFECVSSSLLLAA